MADHATHAQRRPAEQATEALPVSTEVTDALSRLDHRARARAVAGGYGSAPGRYLAVEGGGETRLVPLADVTRIGRGLRADVRFEDDTVSRRHALIARAGRRSRLLDDRSSNGTFLNGRRIHTADLRHGDVVRLGRIAVRYVEIPG